MKKANEIKNWTPEKIKTTAEKTCHKCTSLDECENKKYWENCQKIR